MKIGILEDDPAQAELLLSWLAEEGHEPFHAATASEFLTLFQHQPMDMAIFDWELPDSSGVEVLQALRQNYESQLPVLFSTQRNAEDDIVTALKAGADDYLSKPLRQAELLARIEALSRRAGIAQISDSVEIGPFRLDSDRETISLDGEPVKLTRKDYLVARQLFLHFGKILSREYLLRNVWGIDAELDTRTIDVHVSRVRRSLKISPDMGYAIRTIYQHGYRLEKVV